MATTTPQPRVAGHDVRFNDIYDAYVAALGDCDKAAMGGDLEYYSGLADAYYDVLVTFGEIEPEEEGVGS